MHKFRQHVASRAGGGGLATPPRRTVEAAAKPQLKWAAHLFFLSVLRQSLSFYTLDVCSTLSFFLAPYRFTGVRAFLDNSARQLSWWLQRLSSSDSRAASSFHAFRLRLLASICLASLRSSTAIMCSRRLQDMFQRKRQVCCPWPGDIKRKATVEWLSSSQWATPHGHGFCQKALSFLLSFCYRFQRRDSEASPGSQCSKPWL